MRAKLFVCSAAAALLAAAAPVGPRLGYDPAVFLAGDCLSPAPAECGPAPVRAAVSASAALLDAGMHPRLPVDFSGMLDIGPEVTGGGEAQVATASR